MTRVVWKYEMVGPDMALYMPPGAVVLHAAVEDDTSRMVVWALVDPERTPELERRRLIALNTGERVPDDTIYVATAIAPEGIVWHVFELLDEEADDA